MGEEYGSNEGCPPCVVLALFVTRNHTTVSPLTVKAGRVNSTDHAALRLSVHHVTSQFGRLGSVPRWNHTGGCTSTRLEDETDLPLQRWL